MNRVALAECTNEELGDAVAQVHGIETAARAALVELVTVCDERKTWVEDGAPSLESWLAMRLGIAWRSAGEIVRVSRALSDLPVLTEGLASGALSWDKVRALATMATPEDEARWTEDGRWMSAARLERAARRHRDRSEAAAAVAQRGRKLLFRDHPEHPVTRISGWLPTDQAEVIRSAVEPEADRVPSNPETGELDPYAARRVDGLYKICSQHLASDADVDRATVVLHEQAGGSLTMADGTGLLPSVAERLRCDCREQHPDGSVSQIISAALRRKILARDGGCTFPGCEQRHWVQLHHVIPRSRRGPTAAWNLRGRCGFHHHVVHLPGWREEWGSDGELHIFRPDGTEVTTRPPPPLRSELRERLDDWLPFTGADPPDPERADSS